MNEFKTFEDLLNRLISCKLCGKIDEFPRFVFDAEIFSKNCGIITETVSYNFAKTDNMLKLQLDIREGKNKKLTPINLKIDCKNNTYECCTNLKLKNLYINNSCNFCLKNKSFKYYSMPIFFIDGKMHNFIMAMEEINFTYKKI